MFIQSIGNLVMSLVAGCFKCQMCRKYNSDNSSYYLQLFIHVNVDDCVISLTCLYGHVTRWVVYTLIVSTLVL